MSRLAPLLLAAATACATAKPPPWVVAPTGYESKVQGYTLAPPDGWMRNNLPEGEESYLVLTRDAPVLQRLIVGAPRLGAPVKLGTSTRVVPVGASPMEAAEVVLDDLRSASGVVDVTVLENAPASLSGRRGFRLALAYRDALGLALRAVVYGAATDDRLYFLAYTAPARHYFPADLETFERVVASFRITAPARPPDGA